MRNVSYPPNALEKINRASSSAYKLNLLKETIIKLICVIQKKGTLVSKEFFIGHQRLTYTNYMTWVKHEDHSHSVPLVVEVGQDAHYADNSHDLLYFSRIQHVSLV